MILIGCWVLLLKDTTIDELLRFDSSNRLMVTIIGDLTEVGSDKSPATL